MKLWVACLALTLLPAALLIAQQPPTAADGKALFHEKCAMCHEKGGMGTGLLARRVQPAELLQRRDLKPDFIFQAARSGIGNMPAIPRGEASDEQLRIIANFLAQPPEQR